MENKFLIFYRNIDDVTRTFIADMNINYSSLLTLGVTQKYHTIVIFTIFSYRQYEELHSVAFCNLHANINISTYGIETNTPFTIHL